MKKSLLLCGALLALSATVASAANGVAIRWNNCIGAAALGLGGPAESSVKTFACATNAGTNRIMGSFELGADFLGVSGTEDVIDIAAAGATLPAWWEYANVGACRLNAMSLTPSSITDECADWAAGQASGGLGAYNLGQRGPNTARFIAASAVPNAVTVAAGATNFCFNISINNTLSTGVGSCGGCSTPVCIVFNSCNVVTSNAALNRKVTGPSNGTDSNVCMWQGGGSPVVGPITGCPAATPTKNATWSQVKSLYR